MSIEYFKFGELAPLLNTIILAWSLGFLLMLFQRGPTNWAGAGYVPYLWLFTVPVMSSAQWVYTIRLNPTLPLSNAIWTLGLSAATLGASIAIFLVWYSPFMNRRFGKTWVKALDFPYLALAFLGLVRAVNASSIVGEERSTIIDRGAILAISFAIGIRLSKTIIEVFFDDWVRSEIHVTKQ